MFLTKKQWFEWASSMHWKTIDQGACLIFCFLPLTCSAVSNVQRALSWTSSYGRLRDFPMNHLLPSQLNCPSAWHLAEPVNLPPPKVLHKQGFNKGLFSYCYAFLAAGGGWVDLPVDGSSAGGETTSRSDIELVARLLERRRLGKKGTCHCEFCLIKLIT